MKETFVRCARVGFAGILASGGLCAAESPDPVTNLPPVVVEASRLGKTAAEMPQYVETISRDRIAASGATDVPRLLQRTSGVFVRNLGGGNPALAQLALRGYGESSFGRVQVVLDGERLNNPDMSAPNLSRIPLDAVERVEILHGPQTVLHGDAASAGLLNVVTEAPDYDRHAYLEAYGGSWNTFGARVGARAGDAESGVTGWANGDWAHSDGYRRNSGYDIWNAAGGVRKDWANGSQVRVSAFYSDSEYELPGALSRAAWKDDPRSSVTPRDHARLHAYGVNVTGKGVIDDENYLKLPLTFSQRRMRAFYHNDYGGGYVYDEYLESEIFSYSAAPQWVHEGRIGSFDDTFTLGGDFQWDTLRGDERYTGSYVSHAKPDQERFVMGGFAQNEFFFTDELSLVLGARLARSMARNERAARSSRNDNLSAYEAALNWRPVEKAKTFVKWSRFYRNPFLDETPWYYNAAGVYLPKEILAPERGCSVDVGGDWEFLQDWSVGGALFAGETKNEIFYDAGKGANVNSPDSVLREGLETYLGWGRDKVAAVNLRYALTFAEFTEGAYDDKRVPLVPRHQVRLDGRVWLHDDVSVRGGYRYVADQVSCSDFANAYDRIPGFGLFDLGAAYEPSWSVLRGFTFAFDIDNLFDKNYCDYSTYGSSYYPGAGRCYVFRVKYRF